MRISCLRICTILFLSTAAYISAANISMGVKGGLNLAAWRGAEDGEDVGVIIGEPQGKKFTPGLNAGIVLGIGFNDIFTLQPELTYSIKGFKQEYTSTQYDRTLYLRIPYIELPVLLKFTIPVGSVNPILYTGPTFGLRTRISGYYTEDGKKTELNSDETFAYNNHVRIFDLGMVLGGGVDIKAGPGRILLDARFSLGFLKVWFGSNVADGYPEEKNRMLSFLAGYVFDF